MATTMNFNFDVLKLNLLVMLVYYHTHRHGAFLVTVSSTSLYKTSSNSKIFSKKSYFFHYFHIKILKLDYFK
jgi:hypothetical protein